MRRWNGWGDETYTYPLRPEAASYLAQVVGAGTAPTDVSLADVVALVPPSRLRPDPLYTIEPVDRILHARGQSLPDWIALRTGAIPVFPDAVAYPTEESQIRGLIRLAVSKGIRLIPYGAGSSVVGHVNVLPSDGPVLTVDMSRLNRLLSLDEVSQLATFQAGVYGPEIESQLRARGLTLGHYPQSFELSSLGGWVVTRSNGQQSLGYGRIEAMFAGGRLEAPAGTLDLPSFPASAAGPDLRELVLGSEGRLGILTQATVRVRAVPEAEEFRGVFFPDFERGQAAVREMMQARLPLSMLRLSTAMETETTLALAGHVRLIHYLKEFLRWRGIAEERSLLIVGATGSRASVQFGRSQALAIARQYGGVDTGTTFGKEWRKNRFRSPYLRNTLWEAGYALDTLETAVCWRDISVTIAAIESALRPGLEDVGEKVLCFTHLSHTYPWGSNIYTTYLYRIPADGDAVESLRRWQVLKQAASRAIVQAGGTITHQHGIGIDHRPYLSAEKGPLGMSSLAKQMRVFDPQGLMNPGKLLGATGGEATENDNVAN